MSAFIIGIQVREGLDSKIYRVRVIVDRVDGGELTPEDPERIEAVYPSKPAKAAKRRTKSVRSPAARKVKTSRKSGRAA